MNLLVDASDKLDERVKTFFQQAKKQKLTERDTEYTAIRKDYYKVLDNAGNTRYKVELFVLQIVIFMSHCIVFSKLT